MERTNHFGQQQRGKSTFMRECAVMAAKAGKKVLVVESLGNVMLEPYTGNVASVSLNDKYGGMEIGEISLDEANL